MKGITLTRKDFRDMAGSLTSYLGERNFNTTKMQSAIEEFFNEYYSETKTEIAENKAEIYRTEFDHFEEELN